MDEDAEEVRTGVRPGRRKWKEHEARALFNTPLFRGARSGLRRHMDGRWIDGDALYWIVPITATTGMRREEIAQLRVRHLKRHDPASGTGSPIRYFDLTDRKLSLKNKESRRRVPVPDALVRLGLIEDLVEGRDDG